MRGEALKLYHQAIHLASYYGYEEVTIDHMLFAGLGTLNPTIKEAYVEAGLTYIKFYKYENERANSEAVPIAMTSLDPTLREELANYEGLTEGMSPSLNGSDVVDLLAFLLSRETLYPKALDHMGVNKGKLLSAIYKRLDESTQSSLAPYFKGVQINVENYCKDITDMAAKGEIDPLIGRTVELDRMIQILGRRRKNNPVILGEAGTGKTCLVEGLALAIHNKDPRVERLWDKRIVELDLHLMLAGTKYRGQFEDRLTGLVKELEADPNLIVFVDEVHVVMGAGKVEGGAGDAANILKPSLARGRVQMIGATTKDEYNIIKGDPALERRFQPLELHELSDEEVFDILKGIKKTYEEFHQVEYTDESLEAILKLGKEIPKRNAPDVQIDLLDEVGSRYKGETITAELVEGVFAAQMHSSQNKEKKLGFV